MSENRTPKKPAKAKRQAPDSDARVRLDALEKVIHVCRREARIALAEDTTGDGAKMSARFILDAIDKLNTPSRAGRKEPHRD